MDGPSRGITTRLRRPAVSERARRGERVAAWIHLRPRLAVVDSVPGHILSYENFGFARHVVTRNKQGTTGARLAVPVMAIASRACLTWPTNAG